jgi:hypothetical protein
MLEGNEKLINASTWWNGQYPTGDMESFDNSDPNKKHVLNVIPDKVSSVVVEGVACCKAYAYTDSACTTPTLGSSPISASASYSAGLPPGTVATRQMIGDVWCNDCVRCVTLDDACPPTPRPTSTPTSTPTMNCIQDRAAGKADIGGALDPWSTNTSKMQSAGWSLSGCSLDPGYPTEPEGFTIWPNCCSWANAGAHHTDDGITGFWCPQAPVAQIAYTFECSGSLDITFRNNAIIGHVILNYDGVDVVLATSMSDKTWSLNVESGKTLSLREVGTIMVVKSWDFQSP